MADGKAADPVAKPDGQSAGAVCPPGQGSYPSNFRLSGRFFLPVACPARPCVGWGLGLWLDMGLRPGWGLTGWPLPWGGMEPEPKAPGDTGGHLGQVELDFAGAGSLWAWPFCSQRSPEASFCVTEQWDGFHCLGTSSSHCTLGVGRWAVGRSCVFLKSDRAQLVGTGVPPPPGPVQGLG